MKPSIGNLKQQHIAYISNNDGQNNGTSVIEPSYALNLNRFFFNYQIDNTVTFIVFSKTDALVSHIFL